MCVADVEITPDRSRGVPTCPRTGPIAVYASVMFLLPSRRRRLSLLAPLSLVVGGLVTFGAGGRAQAAEQPGAVIADLCPPAAAGADTPARKRCLGKRVTSFVQPDGSIRRAPFVTPMGYGPPDLHTAYAMPAPAAATPTLGIVVAYHYSGLEADLATYRTQYGLPACSIASGCLTVAYADNNGQTTTVPPASPAGDAWDVQEMLSTELAAAMCPECKLLVIEAESDMDNSLYAAVDVAVQLGARSIALSYGAPEDATSPTLETHFNHPGVLIAAPTGDSGYAGQPAYPATSAFTLSVGGTTLTKTSGGRGWTETTWSSTGSGCSAFIPKPAWQNDPSCTKRMTSDVAAVADPNTGLAVYDSNGGGSWTVTGGTTSSAAIIAGAFASLGVADQGPSFAWAHASAFYDVTSGNNASGGCAPDSYYCTAATGYDGPTGWGTPNGAAIAPFGQSDAGAGDAGMSAGDAGSSEGGAHDGGGGGADASMAADGSSSGGGSDSGGPTGDDGGGGSGSDAGAAASGSGSSSGCGCSFGRVPVAGGWLAMAAALGLLLRRRRSQARR